MQYFWKPYLEFCFLSTVLSFLTVHFTKGRRPDTQLGQRFISISPPIAKSTLNTVPVGENYGRHFAVQVVPNLEAILTIQEGYAWL